MPQRGFARGVQACAVLGALLLEPVHALGQLRAVNTVPSPAADDLSEALAEGAAARKALERPTERTKVLPNLRARAQGTARTCILATEGCAKR
jgi:hypothetical protein